MVGQAWEFVVSDTREVPSIDLGFALSAAAVDAESTFYKMQDAVDMIIKKYGTDQIRYALMVFGTAPSTIVNFGDNLDQNDLRKSVLEVIRPVGDPDLKKALEEAQKMFNRAPERPEARRVLVVFIDKKSLNDPLEIENAAKPLIANEVKIIPAAVVPEADLEELEVITTNKGFVAECVLPLPTKTWSEKIIDKTLIGMRESSLSHRIHRQKDSQTVKQKTKHTN